MRNFRATLSLAAVIATATLSVDAAHAQVPPNQGQPGYHRTTLGKFEVIALSDGTVPLESSVLIAKDRKEVNRLLDRAFVKSPLSASVNAFLIKGIGDRLILVDAGTAELYGPTLNKLPAVLRSLGHQPGDITDILVTHIHTDHTGGLMQGAERAFPNAKVHVEQKEVDYWLSPYAKAAAPDHQKVYFDQALQKFKPYVDSGQVVTFHGATQLFPGIHAQPSPGHTPGHTFFVLESDGQKMVFIGDVLHVQEVQFPRPDITIQFDADSKQARVTRERSFADAALHKYLIAGPHLAFPGIGRIARVPPGDPMSVRHSRSRKNPVEYRFYPLPYKNDSVPRH